jgi:hypothetical protein
MALAAAELVAYALGRPPARPEPRLVALAAALPGLEAHAPLAAQAVTLAGDPEHSELADLWHEDGPNAAFDAVVADLRRRLG